MAKNSYFRFSVLLGVMSVMVFCLIIMFKDMSSALMLEWNLFNLSTVSFPVIIIIDWMSLLFSFHVLIISSCVFWFAVFYMSEDLFFERFIWLLLLFVMSMNILIYSGSFLVIMTGWDGLGITSFILIIYYSSPESRAAGFLTLMINRVGDVVILLSVWMFMMLGMFNINTPLLLSSNILLLMVLASLTKSAQYPFSSWLPAAMAAPTPVSALVHSSTLVTAGVFLLIRLTSGAEFMSEETSILIFCGSITSFLGGVAAVYENDIKKLIALSTLSQLGLMMFTIGLCLPSLAFFHLLTHATFKALLFLVVGIILMMSYGIQDLRLLGGIGKSSPMVMVFFVLGSLCLSALPFLNAFYTKHLILELMMSSSVNFFGVMLTFMGSVGTSMYIFRSIKILCGKSGVIASYLKIQDMMIFLPLFVLSFISVISGWLWTNLFINLIEYCFIHPIFSLIMVLIPLGSIIFLLKLEKPSSSKIFSSLYFTSPSFNSIHCLVGSASKSVKTLDYGWLEPSVQLGWLISYLSPLMHSQYKWPDLKVSYYLRAVIFIISVFILIYV